MPSRQLRLSLALAGTLLALPAFPGLAQDATGQNTGVRLGTGPMYAKKNFYDNLINADEHTILIGLVRGANLAEVLRVEGPVTFFAPNDDAYRKLKPEQVEALKRPEARAQLKRALELHMVPGNLNTTELRKIVSDAGGQGRLKTLSGETLTMTIEGEAFLLKDTKGGIARVTVPDITQSNGALHVVDGVLTPAT